jgi:hypothetical protein
MEAGGSSESLVTTQKTSWCQNSKYHDLQVTSLFNGALSIEFISDYIALNAKWHDDYERLDQ